MSTCCCSRQESLSVIDCVVTLAMSSHLHTECQLICQGCCQQTRFHALRAARTAQALSHIAWPYCVGRYMQR